MLHFYKDRRMCRNTLRLLPAVVASGKQNTRQERPIFTKHFFLALAFLRSSRITSPIINKQKPLAILFIHLKHNFFTRRIVWWEA